MAELGIGRVVGVFLSGGSGVAVVLVGGVHIVPLVSQWLGGFGPLGGVPPMVVHVSTLATSDVSVWCSPATFSLFYVCNNGGGFPKLRVVFVNKSVSWQSVSWPSCYTVVALDHLDASIDRRMYIFLLQHHSISLEELVSVEGRILCIAGSFALLLVFAIPF
ncbi:hypothetical protein L484_010954 [Morus notabilis]|uniref:Uncharacterized protein n=1 Tax=Morus notabilis TaxID=981085 RepID=W9RB18_9ROSA|nr:hypothetical protein L484_010954 [Morus notabilis]